MAATTPALTALGIALVHGAMMAAPSSEDVAFFEKSVRPLLVKHCYECHSTEGKIKGGLSLDSRAGVMKGGDTGPIAEAGKAEHSLLLKAISYRDPDLQMPPSKRLPAAEQAVLREWVQRGLPDPREGGSTGPKQRIIDVAKGRTFWAFKPLSQPEPPQPARHDWSRTAVDQFLLAAMEKAGLEPAPQADKRTLLRRLSFDLTGLPPTPEQMRTFLADDRADAWDRMIETMLASPRYGERWGRHWLDVARYADSNGLDENVALGHAWRYRDWVVRAFNDDKPFDDFLVEQLAGDLLPSATVDQITATGFLSLGAKVLAEPDVEKMKMDVIDEQIDTMGKAFMGMTMGCARCHAHKFDPIKQEDYYALAAIFRSTQSLGKDRTGAIKYWNEHSLATSEQETAKAAHEKRVTSLRADITKQKTVARNELRKELVAHAADYLVAAADSSQAKGLRARYVATIAHYLESRREHPVFSAWHRLRSDLPALRQHFAKRFADPKDAEAQAALKDPAGFILVPDKDAHAFDEATLAKFQAKDEELRQLEAATPELPGVMAVTDGTITPSIPLHIRGSHLTLGAPVPRGFPEVMQTSFTKPILPRQQSGRLELARWMASAEHPLTARVAVNRLWRWHFGTGLVASTDNFGELGARPSHSELLDWLARRFIESGWSMKAMHRLILRSSVYRMVSLHPASVQPSSAMDPHEHDPENKLLSHFPMQRLEAEQIRDAVLAVSGGLSEQVGGKTLPQRNKEFVFNHTSTDRTTYEQSRRTLYMPIIRNHLHEALEQFDYPDPTSPTGNRNSTTVAPQALILLNSPWVMAAAQRLADSTAKLPPEARIAHLYELLYGREVTATERSRAQALLASEPQGMALLCQALMAANEFIFVK